MRYLLSPVANRVWDVSILPDRSRTTQTVRQMAQLTPHVTTLPSNGLRARKDWYDRKSEAILWRYWCVGE